MFGSWKIATLFGIPVRLHFTMLLLPLLMYDAVPMGGVAGVVAWLALVVLLFGSVLLHELGHALAARRFGIGTEDIVLTPIGGMARVTGLPRESRHEILIAVAGPAASLVLAGSALLALWSPLVLFAPTVAILVLTILFQVNGMLGLFNLIPALPMDGGRILRGYLALKLGHLRATRVAVRVGRALAVAGVLVGLFWLDSFSLVLISIFIYFSAGAELRLAELRAFQERLAAGEVQPFSDPGRDGAFRVYTWSWSSGAPHQPPRGGAPEGGVPGPDPERLPRNVIVVEGGKAEVISRHPPRPEGEGGE